MKHAGIKFIVLLLVGAVAFAVGGYLYWKLDQNNQRLAQQLITTNQQLSAATTSLAEVRNENAALNQTLQAEQGKNTIFEAKISEVSTIVGSLQKLSATDPELLRKYSKVFFLSENYIPAQLSSVDPQYLYEKGRPQLIHSGVLPHLQKLLTASANPPTGKDIKLQIISAYRSFYEQEALKYGYQTTYGTGANQFSADQGYSEHQLGTTIDFTTQEVDGNFSQFEKSPGFQWLNDNAYKYGFTLSYQKNNSFYQFEPWHWRFVGVALATYLHDQNKHFYDLDQRELDGYRITIFN